MNSDLSIVAPTTSSQCSSMPSPSSSCFLQPSTLQDASHKRSRPVFDPKDMVTPQSSPRETTPHSTSSKGKSPVRERKKRGIDPAVVETEAKENRAFNPTSSAQTIECLRDEVEYRRLIKCFLGENLISRSDNIICNSSMDNTMKDRENAGEKLVYLSATEATALQLVEYQVLEVCNL